MDTHKKSLSMNDMSEIELGNTQPTGISWFKEGIENGRSVEPMNMGYEQRSWEMCKSQVGFNTFSASQPNIVNRQDDSYSRYVLKKGNIGIVKGSDNNNKNIKQSQTDQDMHFPHASHQMSQQLHSQQMQQLQQQHQTALNSGGQVMPTLMSNQTVKMKVNAIEGSRSVNGSAIGVNADAGEKCQPNERSELIKRSAGCMPKQSNNAICIKGSIITSTTESLTTSATMPVTMITTTSASTAVTSATGGQIFASTSTITSTVSIKETESTYGDHKRKTPSDEKEGTPEPTNKVRLLNDPSNSEELMLRLLNEMTAIKSAVDKGNEKMETLISENNAWKAEIRSIKIDVESVKDSVEMAHNLITDECTAREKAVSDLKQQQKDKSKECNNNAKLIKRHTTKIRGIKDSMKTVQNKLDAMQDANKKACEPFADLKAKVEESLGNIEYPPRRRPL